MAEATPSTLLVELGDSKTHVMINPSMWGGKQVITFLDGYATPLQCRTGLMYMKLLGKPTDVDLNTFPHVLLTGHHEWDPSVLDYTHPSTAGDPTWAPAPSQCGAHDPRIDGFGNYKVRVHHTLTHSPGNSNIAQHKHAITTQPIDFEKLKPYRLVPDGGESSKTPNLIVFVSSRQDDSQSATKPMAEYNPDDLIGRIFLLPK